MKDEHVIGLVGGGVGLYLVYRWKEGETQLPDFGSLLAGLGGGLGGVPSLDLSNLIGGINLGELLKGVAPDANAVEEYLRGCLTGGGEAQGGGETGGEEPAPEQGREATEPFWLPEQPTGLLAEATGFVQAVGETNPWFQGLLGLGGAALGIGTGYAMVRTSPAIGQAATGLVRGATRVASSAWSQLSARAAARASTKTAQLTAQRAATKTVTRYILPVSAKGWMGRTLGQGRLSRDGAVRFGQSRDRGGSPVPGSASSGEGAWLGLDQPVLPC